MPHSNSQTAKVTADTVVFSTDSRGEVHVLLIRRRWEPYQGYWALPGGHVDEGEETKAAALRELGEETGLTTRRLEYVGLYDTPGRDPRGQYTTHVYVGQVENLPTPTAADDAAEAAWIRLAIALAGGFPLAFDHQQILHDAADIALPF